MSDPAPRHDLPLGHLSFCQICASPDSTPILDLGFHPPCDSLLSGNQLNEEERTYPLNLVRCNKCCLVQIDYVVAPEVLFFPDYPYRSGITGTLASNLKGIADTVTDRLKIPQGSLVVDIGSNDGTILQGFKSRGMKVLGVEPTKIAQIAVENGIPTIQSFFSRSLAKRIREEHGPASVVTAANMFAHVAKLGDLIQGVSDLLVDGGMFLTESHYLLDLLETLQYDSIYHEHLKYYSLRPIGALFKPYNFTIVDVERIPNYGGSIRVYAQKAPAQSASERLLELSAAEDRGLLYEARTYDAFRERVIHSKLEFQSMLVKLRREGKTVVGIGCPGRASTLLNYCNVDRDLMPYIAEQSSCLKLGMALPGKHIPIVDEAILFRENPDYAVMLSWHYAEPIIKKLRQKGLKSKIILPLPEIKILD